MKALGMVIFNHNLSLISSPELGFAIAFTIVNISVFTVKGILSTVSAATKTNKNEYLFSYSFLLIKIFQYK